MLYLSPTVSWYKTNARTLPWRTTAKTEKVGSELVPKIQRKFHGFFFTRFADLHPTNERFSTILDLDPRSSGVGGRGWQVFILYLHSCDREGTYCTRRTISFIHTTVAQ
jgi:hypothetical protein